MSTVNSLLNAASVTAALFDQIEQYKDVRGYFKGVDRAEYVNQDPAATPWVGVYKTKIDYEPKVLGHHSKSWKATLIAKLIVQASGKNGAGTEDDLEEAVQRVMGAVLSDLTVNNTIEMLKGVSIEYSYDETDSKTLDFQWAFITLTYETRTGI